MIAPSTRHVPLLLGLAALLAFPIVRGGLEVRRVDDCARPKALLRLEGLPGSGPLTERYERYDADLRQWTQTTLGPATPGMKLRAALIRSFRPIELYTRPPTRLLGPIEAQSTEIDWVRSGPDRLPIQTIFDTTGGRHSMASYLFVYRGRPVRRPLWWQIWSAPQQLWSGTRPLSLLIVAGPVQPAARSAARERAVRWLVAAYELQREACEPPAGTPRL